MFNSLPSGVWPGASSRLGGLHHQPLQRYTHSCDRLLANIDLAFAEEEEPALVCAGWVSVELQQKNMDFLKSNIMKSGLEFQSWHLQDLRLGNINNNYWCLLLSRNCSVQSYCFVSVCRLQVFILPPGGAKLWILHWSLTFVTELLLLFSTLF